MIDVWQRLLEEVSSDSKAELIVDCKRAYPVTVKYKDGEWLMVCVDESSAFSALIWLKGEQRNGQ